MAIYSNTDFLDITNQAKLWQKDNGICSYLGQEYASKFLVGLFPGILFVQVFLLQEMFFSTHKMLGLYRR